MHTGETREGSPEDGGTRRASRWRVAGWTLAALLLLLPLVAMQFSDEVVWNVTDFVFFGTMLFGAGVALELAARRSGSPAYRIGAGVAIAGAFLVVWVNGAVGIIGSEDNAANLVYYGVLAVGLVAALIARFEPQGMARAMIATAVAQASVFVVALIAGWGFTGPTTLFFLAFWLVAARLFQNAAREGLDRLP